MTLDHPAPSCRPPRGDDPALVVRAKAGDAAARDRLARYCQRRAYGFALHFTGHSEDARDIAQDAMVRVFASLARFDSTRAINPWLLSIVRNLVVDRFRRSEVRRKSGECAAAGLVIEAATTDADPETRAARSELQQLIWEGIRRLTAEHREVLVLRDYQDLSYAEIAEVLGIARGTVMSRLHRARLRLRDLVRTLGEANHD